MKKQVNYDKLQVSEQKETNTILWINTLFTIFAGMGGLVYAFDKIVKALQYLWTLI